MNRRCGFTLALLCAALSAPAAEIIGPRVRGSGDVPCVHFIRTGERLILTASEPSRWYHIAPVLRAYDNVPQKRSRIDRIQYRREPCSKHAQRQLELRFDSAGTRYFCAGAVVPEVFAETEAIHRKHRSRVVQVVVRDGDEYLDYLGELFGTPFIMGPMPTAAGWHQTDQRVGSDCAAFATYGRRRMNAPVSYAGPVGILRDLRPLSSLSLTPRSRDGTYRDSTGRAALVGQRHLRAGDVLHFGPQVSIFYADRGIRNLLDAEDLVIQSWRTTPHITTLRASGFFQHPVRLYRWE